EVGQPCGPRRSIEEVQRGPIGRIIVEAERADHKENLKDDRYVEDPGRGHYQHGHVGATGPRWRPQFAWVPARAGLLPGLQPNSPHPHRVGNVFDSRLPQFVGANCQLVPDLFPDWARDADATLIGQAFQARRDVDALAVDAVALDHDVAEVEPDAEFQP